MTDAYKLGAQATDTLTGRNVKVVSAYFASGPASSTAYPFQFGAANYQVTAGKTFYITGIFLYQSAIFGNSTYLQLVYATAANLTTGQVVLATLPQLVGSAPVVIPVCGLSVPASDYVGVINAVAASGGQAFSIGVIGYEA